MALVQCRECGKMVSHEANICPYCGAKMPSQVRHQRRRFFMLAILLLVVGLVAYYGYQHMQSSKGSSGDQTSAPALIPNDTLKAHTIQSNEDEIRKRLDSGESVAKISKETGIRRDEIKKIKKKKAEEDKTKSN